jgi:uncharacterized membrane protein
MKRFITAIALTALATVCVFAQNNSAREEALKKAKVDQDVRQSILTLYDDSDKANALIQADVKIKEAELAKLLLADKIDTAAVRTTLEAIAKMEVDQRMNTIGAEMKIRDLVGKDTWAEIRKYVRENNALKEPAANAKNKAKAK